MSLKITITPQESILDGIVLKDIVDKKLLQKIIKTVDLDEDKNEPVLLNKLLKKITKKGLVSVTYKRIRGIGRTYGAGAIGFQTRRKVIRHTLCYDKYTDIDVENAHPVMLNQICIENGLNHTHLDNYVKNRETLLAEIMELSNVDRDEAKVLFIRIMYGGKVDAWKTDNEVDAELPKHLYDLEKELENIGLMISNSNTEFRKKIVKEKRNKINSIMSFYLQEWENRVLEVMYQYLKDNKLIKGKVATLCYDGIMVNKIDNIEPVLREMEKLIKEKVGFQLVLTEKKMDKIIEEVVKVDEESDDEDLTDNLKMYKYILKYCKERKYKKNFTHILNQSTKSTIVYEPYMEFQDFLNEVFNKECKLYNLFREHPSNMNNMLRYLESYDDEDLPFIKLNKYVFSFNNGYLDISDLNELKFKEYTPNMGNDIITTIHHDLDFDVELLTKSHLDIKTPLFDRICNYHFEDDELLETFYGMCGRLHYPTNQHDRFNCMLFIKGGANTGKSTTGNILMKNHQNIGTISGKMEKTFGLQSLYKKNIIYNPDMNKNFSTLLDKGDFQRIIEGSNLDIPVKNKPSINNFLWTTPLLFLANYFPEYKDSSGAIPRRICAFFMDKFLNVRDTTIEKRCIEGESHLILLKTLKSYKHILKKFEGKTFEDWGIDYFNKGYEEMTTKCNNLYNYLTLPPGDFETWTSYSKGDVVSDKDLKKVVEKYYYMNGIKEKFELDRTTLGRFGYQIKKIRLCASCGKKPTGKRKKEDQCCDKYSNKNRRNKNCIMNMKIHHESELSYEDEKDILMIDDSDDEETN